MKLISEDHYELYDDGIGYVKLIDTMGDEYTPAEDARMSTGKGRLGPDKDSKLNARLLRDSHTSPFEGVLLKFEICTPLFVLRELDRHRTLTKTGDTDEFTSPEEGSRKWFARNEMSGRYIKLPNLYFFPKIVRKQSKSNTQGGGEVSAVSDELQEAFLARGTDLVQKARELYEWACDNGIEKGVARIFNTQNQYTKIRMTGSLKNWCDFLKLRLPDDVLLECRLIAQAINQILSRKYPDLMSTWHNNINNIIKLTREEAEHLYSIIDYNIVQVTTSPVMKSALKKISK